MESLDFSFRIEIDGRAIVMPTGEDQAPSQASIGEDAAIFTLQNNKLMSGEWLLARNKSEDRSLLPKQIMWFKSDRESEDRAQPVSAIKDEGVYQVKFAGASLMAEDSKVFVEMMGDGHPHSVVKV